MRALIVTAFLASVTACSFLAPSDEELMGGGRSAPAGGQSGTDGGSGAAAGNRADGGAAGKGGAGATLTGGTSATLTGGAGATGKGGAATLTGGTGVGVEGGARATGGRAGEAGAVVSEGGEGGSGGEAGEGGSSGSGGGTPICAMPCGANQQCTATPTGPQCTCVDGLVFDGAACRRPRSCDELHRNSPALASGTYALQPQGAATPFQAYCGMALEGGGWTLVVNEGPTFDPTTMGVADAICYSSSCTSIGYSLIPLGSDVMIDISNAPIANATYAARVIVNGVHALSRGKTLRTLFTTGPNYVEAEDNTNLTVRMIGGAACDTLPADMASLVCNNCAAAGCKVPVLVFGDVDAAEGCRTGAVPHFAIGAAYDYAMPWNNCAGWPQDPNYAAFDFYPDYVRVWIR